MFQVINEREAVPLLLLPHCDTISPILSAFLFQSGNKSAFEGCLEIFLSFLSLKADTGDDQDRSNCNNCQ